MKSGVFAFILICLSSAAQAEMACLADPSVNAAALLAAVADGMHLRSGAAKCAKPADHPFVRSDADRAPASIPSPPPVYVAEKQPFDHLVISKLPGFVPKSGPYRAEFKWRTVAAGGAVKEVPDSIQFYVDPTGSDGNCAAMFVRPRVPALKKTCDGSARRR